MEIKEYEIFPKNTVTKCQDGGSFPLSLNRRMNILKIFLTLAYNNAFDANLNLLKEDGSPNTNANVAELLEYTQSKQDRIDGLDDFITQLLRTNIDLNLIINANIKERLRASRERRNTSNFLSPPSAPPPPPPSSTPMDTSDSLNIQSDNISNNNFIQPPEGVSVPNNVIETNNNNDTIEPIPGPSNQYQDNDQLRPVPSNINWHVDDGDISPIIGDKNFENVEWKSKRVDKRQISDDDYDDHKNKRHKHCDEWHVEHSDEEPHQSQPQLHQTPADNTKHLKIKADPKSRKRKTYRASKSYNLRHHKNLYHLDSDTDEYEWDDEFEK